jgi:hypothetical protein
MPFIRALATELAHVFVVVDQNPEIDCTHGDLVAKKVCGLVQLGVVGLRKVVMNGGERTLE